MEVLLGTTSNWRGFLANHVWWLEVASMWVSFLLMLCFLCVFDLRDYFLFLASVFIYRPFRSFFKRMSSIFSFFSCQKPSGLGPRIGFPWVAWRLLHGGCLNIGYRKIHWFIRMLSLQEQFSDPYVNLLYWKSVGQQ